MTDTEPEKLTLLLGTVKSHPSVVPWLLIVLLALLPGRAQSLQEAATPGRFRLWHDLEDVMLMTWGGAQMAFTPSTLVYLLPAGAIVGGASAADDAVQAQFPGNDERDALVRAGKDYATLYGGPVQAGLCAAGELTGNSQLSLAGKKALAALLGTQGLIQPLKYLTHRQRPDGSNRLSFPSADAGVVSAIIPAIYAEYGVFPAALTTASAAFVGFARLYGNKHYLSDVFAGYAIGVGWGLLVETSQLCHSRWTLLPMHDGGRTAGVVFPLRF